MVLIFKVLIGLKFSSPKKVHFHQLFTLTSFQAHKTFL